MSTIAASLYVAGFAFAYIVGGEFQPPDELSWLRGVAAFLWPLWAAVLVGDRVLSVVEHWRVNRSNARLLRARAAAGTHQEER